MLADARVQAHAVNDLPRVQSVAGGRPFRTLNVIDEGNREALRIECGSSIPAARLVRTMNQLIEVYGKPHAIRMDNGPEMTSEKFIEWAKEQGIVLMFIQPGKPNQNAFVERFNRSFRDEVLNANLFNSVDQAQEAADDWVQDYNEFRPHESLGDVAPMEFMPRKFVKEISSFKLFSIWGSLRTDRGKPDPQGDAREGATTGASGQEKGD